MAEGKIRSLLDHEVSALRAAVTATRAAGQQDLAVAVARIEARLDRIERFLSLGPQSSPPPWQPTQGGVQVP